MNEGTKENGKEIKVKGYKAARNQDEGVQAFAVYSPEFGKFYHSYWEEKYAQGHIEYEETRKMNSQWVINSEEIIMDEIHPWKVRSVSDQKIEVSGNEMGCTFSLYRKGSGRRTIRRAVHNLRREEDSTGVSLLLGDVEWKGRKFTVRHYLLRYWVFHEWIGFTDEVQKDRIRTKYRVLSRTG